MRCEAEGQQAQIAVGIAQVARAAEDPDDWVVQCRSTPRSILEDLRGKRDARGEWRGRR